MTDAPAQPQAPVMPATAQPEAQAGVQASTVSIDLKSIMSENPETVVETLIDAARAGIPVYLTSHAYEYLASILKELGVNVKPLQELPDDNLYILVDVKRSGRARSRVEIVVIEAGREVARNHVKVSEFVAALKKAVKRARELGSAARYYQIVFTDGEESVEEVEEREG